MTTTKTFSSADNGFKFTLKAAATPQFRTDRLVSYLTSVCKLGDAWQTKNLQPLLQRWMGKRDFLAVCREAGVKDERLARLESLLKHLHRHQVKDWLAEVLDDEEGTPARALADTVDYWSEFAPKLGKALLRVRAVQHEGKILFLADDVAAIYGGVYATRPVGTFLADVVDCQKNLIIKKLTYQEILAASPASVADTASIKRGKTFLDERSVLWLLQQAKSPAALQFRQYLIDTHQEKRDAVVGKKIKVRSEARQRQLKVYPTWDGNNAAHGASTIRSNGEVFYHVTDGKYETQAAYCAKHKVEKPFSENLPDALVQRTNLVREVSMSLADSKNTGGQHAYDAVIAEAAGAVNLLQTNPSALAAFVESMGMTRHPRSTQRS